METAVGIRALDGVSVKIKAGEFVVVVVPAAAEKARCST